MALPTTTLTIDRFDPDVKLSFENADELMNRPEDFGYTSVPVAGLYRFLSENQLAQRAGGNQPRAMSYAVIETQVAIDAGLISADLSDLDDVVNDRLVHDGVGPVKLFCVEARRMNQHGTTWKHIYLYFNDRPSEPNTGD